MSRCPYVLTVYLSILTLTYIALYRFLILPFHSYHLGAPFILALPLTLSSSSASFFLQVPLQNFLLSSFIRRGSLPECFLPPTPPSIHYPFIALDFITISLSCTYAWKPLALSVACRRPQRRVSRFSHFLPASLVLADRCASLLYVL